MGKTREITRLEAQLRQAMADSGMAQKELSALSGVDSGQLSRFTKGERTLTLRSAEKMAGVLGLELRSRAAPIAKPRNAGPSSGRPHTESSFVT